MLCLHDVQSPINIGLILRIGEQFDIPVSIHDPRRILADPAKRRTVSDFACGALERGAPFTDSYSGANRIIATCLDADAIPLDRFAFRPDDAILLGNEYDGLPHETIVMANASVYIPLPPGYLPKPRSFAPIDQNRARPVAQNGTPNLNVAMAAAIIAHAFRSQIRASRRSAPGTGARLRWTPQPAMGALAGALS